MSYLRDLENKIDALQERNKYLTERYHYAMKTNEQLRKAMYGSEYKEEMHIRAHNVINSFYNIEIDNPTRKTMFVRAREFYYSFLRKYTQMSLKELSETLYIKQDHSTVINSLRSFDRHMKMEKDYRKEYKTIEKCILSNESI